MLEKARERLGGLIWALIAIVLGMIGVTTRQFWTPRARRTVQGDGARILGGITLVIGTVVLICWVLAVTGGDPDPDDRPNPSPKRFGRARERKPGPIDPAEEIAAEALGLGTEDRPAKPPPTPAQ